MIARGAAHAAAGIVSADINLLRPRLLWETVQQPLAVMLLIVLVEGHLALAAMIAGADTVLLIIRILRREIAVVAQHLFKL